MSDKYELETVAQRRSLLQWLHEKVNVPRQAAELYSDTYKDQMRGLREIDDSVREHAKSLRGFLKSMKLAARNRSYIDVAHFAGNINDTVKSMVREKNSLQSSLKEEFEDFYGDHQHADLERDYFAKEAGFLDLFKGKSRHGAGELFEKMHRNLLKERARAVNNLVSSADYLVNFAFETLKELGTARARGDVGSYLEHLDKLGKKQAEFGEKFKGIYEKHIAPLVSRVKGKRDKGLENEPIDLVSRPKEELANQNNEIEVSPKDFEPDSGVHEGFGGREDYVPSSDESAERISEIPATDPPPSEIVPESAQVPVNQEVESVEYQIPEHLLRPVSKSPAIEIDRDSGKAKRVMANLITSVVKSGMSRQLQVKALIDFSADFDDVGDVESSVICLAAAQKLSK